ncbi:MAG: AAA family ATPase, partial [Firmicutes bacterium]|nr:AAA family ATPase [Bacillota bacterium]
MGKRELEILKMVIDMRIAYGLPLVIKCADGINANIFMLDTLKEKTTKEIFEMIPNYGPDSVMSSEETRVLVEDRPMLMNASTRRDYKANEEVCKVFKTIKHITANVEPPAGLCFFTTASFLFGAVGTKGKTAALAIDLSETEAYVMNSLGRGAIKPKEKQFVDYYGYKVSKELREMIAGAELDVLSGAEENLIDALALRIILDENDGSRILKTLPNISKLAEKHDGLGLDLMLEDDVEAPAKTNPKSNVAASAPGVNRVAIEAALEEFSELENLNKKMRDYKPALAGREDILERLQEALCRKEKKNVMLVGDGGVGKTAIVEYLAEMLNENKALQRLCGKTIYQLHTSRLVANGAKYVGEVQKRFYAMIGAVKKAGDVILFADEIHTMPGAGKCEGGGDSVGQMIKPDIARGEISLIGATTTEEYEKYVASDQAFIRRFTVIRIEEPTVELTKKMLKAQVPRYMEDYNTKISDELIGLIVEGAAKIKSRRFPDKAIDALDVACVKATKN